MWIPPSPDFIEAAHIDPALSLPVSREAVRIKLDGLAAWPGAYTVYGFSSYVLFAHFRPWHFLYFLPEPQGQGSLGMIFFAFLL